MKHYILNEAKIRLSEKTKQMEIPPSRSLVLQVNLNRAIIAN